MEVSAGRGARLLSHDDVVLCSVAVALYRIFPRFKAVVLAAFEFFVDYYLMRRAVLYRRCKPRVVFEKSMLRVEIVHTRIVGQ